MKNFIFVILTLWSLGNCLAQKNTTSQQRASENPKQPLIILKNGENKFLEHQEMNITYLKSEYSDKHQAHLIFIEVMGIYTRPKVLKISTKNIPGLNHNHKAFFNGWEFSLIKFRPEEITLNIKAPKI